MASSVADEAIGGANPLAKFDAWLVEAIEKSGLVEPNAVTLTTSSLDGRPSARTVLLRGFAADGLRFYTNYESRKGQHIGENALATMLFYWKPLCKEVRIEGRVERLPHEESADYFASRPRDSQISAAISPQSQVIASRDHLQQLWRQLENDSDGSPISKPDHWGGYRLIPDSFHFLHHAERSVFKAGEREAVAYCRSESGNWQYDESAE